MTTDSASNGSKRTRSSPTVGSPSVTRGFTMTTLCWAARGGPTPCDAGDEGPAGTLATRTSDGRRFVVRAIHRPSTTGARSCPRRGTPAQPQLHRHRAHPARPHPRGRGGCREGARLARDHARGGPRVGRGGDRHDGVDAVGFAAVHPAREEGARALAARGAPARPLLHRDRAHAARA